MENQYTEKQLRDAFKDVDENTKDGRNPHGEHVMVIGKDGLKTISKPQFYH